MGDWLEATNGTDEGVLRSWIERERDEWIRSFIATMDDAIQQLQGYCFEEHWDELANRGIDEEQIGRASLEIYTGGLTDIFAFVRASGAISDPVAWSQMKTEHRALALRKNVEQPVVQALEDSLYAAESAPLGDHSLYRSWTGAIMLFLFQFVANGPEYPGARASEEEKLTWGYQALKSIEDHHAFHMALEEYVQEPGVKPVIIALTESPLDAIIAHSESMAGMKRFDLVLNTGLRWVVEAVERG